MRINIYFILLLCSQVIFGQNQVKIDSLKIRLDNSVEDSTKINLLLQLANEYSTTDLLKALHYDRSALETANKTGDDLYTVRALTTLGRDLIFIGDYDEALASFLSALKIAQEDNHLKNEEVIIYTHLGIIQDRIEQFDAALHYYFTALNIYNESVGSGKPLSISRKIQSLFNNIGNVYLSNNQPDKAEEYYLKGLELAESRNDYPNIGIICNNLGKLEMQKENYSKAFEYLNKSINARQKINDKSGMAKSYYHLSSYYYNTNQYEKALEYAQDALKLSQEVKEPLSSQISAMLLYETYKKLGRFDKALEYHELYKQFSDSLINDNKIREITSLQMKFKYEEEEREKNEKQQKIRFTGIVVVSSLLLGLIILGLLFILSSSRNKHIRLENDRLGKDMAVKNKELTTNVIYLMKKNELIDNITERLLKLKSQLKGENVNKLHHIILDLQSISDDDVWKEFEYRFQSVHEEFYQSLKSKFPDLSPSEIRLAAFLRLNMTTKEIASITGQSVNSLETARYRLRKKLGINNQEVNLVTFLLDI